MDIKKNISIKNKLWAIILVAQFSFFYILSKIDFAVNFFSNLFEWKKNIHILLFSKFGFSVGDVLYTVAVIFLSFHIINLLRKRNSKTLKSLLIFINIFYLIYQSFWGMLYFQTPMIDKLQKKEITNQDLKNLAVKYLALCKESREKVSENNLGIFVIKDLRKIESEILVQQTHIPANITLKTPIKVISVKPSIFGRAMNYTGISGYYNPFTAESQFDSEMPHTQIPFTLAHEMSHQLGFAKEQEASFIAYLCSRNSVNKDLRYSAQLYVLKSLLRSLAKNDGDFVKKILSQYSTKMQKDRNNELAFIRKHEGLLSDIFGFTNDLFLKSNQQDGSITYSYFITLLVLYET